MWGWRRGRQLFHHQIAEAVAARDAQHEVGRRVRERGAEGRQAVDVAAVDLADAVAGLQPALRGAAAGGDLAGDDADEPLLPEALGHLGQRRAGEARIDLAAVDLLRLRLQLDARAEPAAAAQQLQPYLLADRQQALQIAQRLHAVDAVAVG